MCEAQWQAANIKVFISFPTIYNLFSMTDFTTSIFHNKEPALRVWVCERGGCVGEHTLKVGGVWVADLITDTVQDTRRYSDPYYYLIYNMHYNAARVVWIVNMLAKHQHLKANRNDWCEWNETACVQLLCKHTPRLYYLRSTLRLVNNIWYSC